VMQGIRAAQERFRAENLVYLNVSSAGEAGWYPAAPPGRGEARHKRAFFGDHDDAANWRLLNPTVPGPVEFSYRVNAGAPSQPMTVPEGDIAVTWPSAPGYWYVIQASGNADSDAVYSYYVASSLNGEIFRKNEGE
jgi:hypothetical protein